VLNLCNNLLARLPPEIGRLSSLGLLELSANQLAALPPEIGNLSALNRLGLLANSRLISLPFSMLRLTDCYMELPEIDVVPPIPEEYEDPVNTLVCICCDFLWRTKTIVEKSMVPQELSTLLANGGRECMQCERSFFGVGLQGKVKRTVQQTKWMFEVLCCSLACFNLMSKDPDDYLVLTSML